MYCKKCGKKLETEDRFCPACGQVVDNVDEEASHISMEEQKQSQWKPENQTETYSNIKQKRGDGENNDQLKKIKFWKFILLNVVTLGIYGIYVGYKFTINVDKLCEGDGRNSSNYPMVSFLWVIIGGFYIPYWIYNQAERMHDIAPKYKCDIKSTGMQLLLWDTFGHFIIIGPVIAWYHMLKNMNLLIDRYTQGIIDNDFKAIQKKKNIKRPFAIFLGYCLSEVLLSVIIYGLIIVFSPESGVEIEKINETVSYENDYLIDDTDSEEVEMETVTETTEVNSNNEIFDQLPRGFDFSSGAGGWATHFDLNSDGTFSGQYLDSDMGDTGNGYSDGTVYICNFVGKFSAPKQVSTYVYSMELEYLNTDGKPGDTYYDQDIRYIHSEPYGLDNADEFLIYFPGVKMTDLPEGFISWLGQSIYAQTTETLNCYGIYNVNAEEGFVAADNSSAAKTIRDIDLADYLDGIDNLIPQYLNFLESEDYYLYVDDTRMVSVYCDEYQIPQYIDIACDADVSPSLYGIRIGMDEWDAVDKVPSTYTLIEAEEVGYTYFNLDDKTFLIWWTDEDTSKITRIVYLTEYGYDNYWTPPGMNLQYILPESAERVYSVDELAYLSDDEIQMAINEIYARHGRKFDDESVQDFFNSKSWYYGNIEPEDFSDSILSEVENENLQILISMRN